MSIIATTLSKKYQPQWGVAWALREILSNALDGEVRGKNEGRGAMSLDYSKRSRTLTVTNDNTVVPQGALLLGTSESRSREDCIGTFGEGLPMALLVLARNEYPVTIYNGIEKWEPSIGQHPELFEDVLLIKTRQVVKDRGHFSVEIGQIDEEDFAELQGMFLKFDPRFDAEQAIQAPGGERVLLQPGYKGKVYNKGVFVCTKPVLFGYDVSMDLNRDRSAIDEWSLKERLGRILRDAVRQDKERFLPVLESAVFGDDNSMESQDSYSSLKYDSTTKNHILARFTERYGANALPVESQKDADEAATIGKKGVVCSRLLYSIIGDKFSSVIALKGAAATVVTQSYPLWTLSEAEQANLDAVESKIEAIYPAALTKVKSIEVVTFGSPVTRSSAVKAEGDLMTFNVARFLTGSRYDLLLQYIRELVVNKMIEGKNDVATDVMTALAKMAVGG